MLCDVTLTMHHLTEPLFSGERADDLPAGILTTRQADNDVGARNTMSILTAMGATCSTIMRSSDPAVT